MRTTLDLEDALLRRVKRVAGMTGRTLTAVVEDGLRLLLAQRQAAKRRKSVELPVSKGGRLLPGVDLDSTSELLDRMEGRLGSH